MARAPESLRTVGREAEKAGAKVGGFGASLQKIDTGALGRSLSIGLTLPIVGLGTAAVKAAVDMQALRAGLTSITGSSAETERQLTRLKKVAEMPGLGFKEAVQGSIRLQAAGLSAEMSERSLSAMGNAIAAVGGGKAQLDGVTLALSQIASKGKVSAEEINQLNERIPQIRQAMNAAFGTSDTEALSRMGIGSEEFIAKITTEFEKIPKVVGGAKNSLETAADSIEVSLARVGEKALPMVAAGAEKLATGVERLAGWFDKMSPAGQATVVVLGAIAAATGPVLIGVSKLVVAYRALAAAQALGAGAGAMGAGGAVAGGVAAGGAAIGGATAAGVVGGAAAVGAAGWAGFEIGKNIWGVNSRQASIDRAQGALKGNSSAEQNARRKAQGLPYFDERGNVVRPSKAPVTSFTDPKLAKQQGAAADAQFGAQVSGAQAQLAGGDEATAARRELATMLPILKERSNALAAQAKALEPHIKEDAEKAKEFWSIKREQADLQSQAVGLQQSAAKEAQEQQKKASEAAKKAAQDQQGWARTQFDAAMQVAQVRAGTVAEEFRAQAEAAASLPLITERQKQLEAEGRKLLPEAKTSADAAQRFAELNAEYWSLQEQGQRMAEGASKEIQSNQKKAEEAQKKAHREVKKQSEDFAKFRVDVANEMQKRADEATRAFQAKNSERMGFADGRTRLAEAQINNNPFANDKQKKQAIVPFLVEQFKELMRPVQGESRMDAMNRQIGAEGLKGQIVGNLGQRGRAAAMTLGQLNQIGQQAQSTPFASRAVAEAQQAAEQAKKLAPAPVVMQLVLDGAALNPQKLWEAFQMMRRKESAESGL